MDLWAGRVFIISSKYCETAFVILPGMFRGQSGGVRRDLNTLMLSALKMSRQTGIVVAIRRDEACSDFGRDLVRPNILLYCLVHLIRQESEGHKWRSLSRRDGARDAHLGDDVFSGSRFAGGPAWAMSISPFPRRRSADLTSDLCDILELELTSGWCEGCWPRCCDLETGESYEYDHHDIDGRRSGDPDCCEDIHIPCKGGPRREYYVLILDVVYPTQRTT